MAYSNTAKGAIAQKTAELGGQFQANEMARRQQNINNLAKELGIMTDFEKTNYDQYRNTLSDVNNQNAVNFNQFSDLFSKATGLQNTQFNQNIVESGVTGTYSAQKTSAQKEIDRKATNEQTKILEDKELGAYGTILTPQVRSQLDMLNNLPPAFKMTDLTKYSNDYAAEINRRAMEFPNDPIIPYLVAARTQKILSNPILLQQYGKDIGLANANIASNAINYQAKQFETYINSIKAQYAATSEKAKLDEILAKTLQAQYEAMKGQYSYAKSAWDAAKAQIETLALPEQIKSELNLRLEQIKSQQANQVQSYASAGASGAQTDYTYQRTETEKYNTQIYGVKADEALDKADAQTQLYYQEYIKSGKSFDDWLKSAAQDQYGSKKYTYQTPSPGAAGPVGQREVTWAESMNRTQLDLLTDNAKLLNFLINCILRFYYIPRCPIY
jgi:hypothetical protein